MKPITIAGLLVLAWAVVSFAVCLAKWPREARRPQVLFLGQLWEGKLSHSSSRRTVADRTFRRAGTPALPGRAERRQFIVTSKLSHAFHPGLQARLRPGGHSDSLPRSPNCPRMAIASRVRDGSLLLIGADDRGTLYAVYDLLERLGCRWLAPALAFYQGAHEYVPKCETLSLSLSEDVLQRPALKYRKLYVEEGHSHNCHQPAPDD